MTTDELIRRFHDLACVDPETERDADSLIGFFQVFRPDGAAIADLYGDLDEGPELVERLQRLYQAAGEDRRPQGGRDAYFIVRRPAGIDPEHARQLAESWLDGMAKIAACVEDQSTLEALRPRPAIRVLEGVPPKHPRQAEDKSQLLKAIQAYSTGWYEKVQTSPYADVLRPAYYFTTCDPMVRDYLMWPLYAGSAGVDDPFEPYFQLWRHGVKYRIFGESQIDLYLPRASRND